MPSNDSPIVDRYLIWAAAVAGILVVVMGLFVYLTTG
jgi:hypothetical protein